MSFARRPEVIKLLDAFRLAWKQGKRPDIDQVIAYHPEPQRTYLLIELVHIELEQRIALHEASRVEEFIERYPQLVDNKQTLLDLVQTEFELRQKMEPELGPAEYIRRFPWCRNELRAALDRLIRPGHVALRLNCPHCQNPIEVVDDQYDSDDVLCPSCGSSFKLANDQTRSWKPERLPQLGKFKLLEPVGRGAFGTVYRAHDTDLDRIVAIKLPRSGSLVTKEDEDRFVREARSVAQLRHESIVSVFETGRSDQFPYIVSEFVDGTTLSDMLTSKRPGFRESAELIAKVSEALQYAHDQGVVHRDVKPSNIMLDSKGKPHLMDFGLARRDAGEITMTIEGQVLGTPAYMSPEQARGEGHRVDGRSDVYSLGVILFELLTGELPFRGNTRMLLNQVLHDEPRSPRSLNDRIPRDLETVCQRAMAKEPGRRYESARAMAADLRAFLQGKPIKARPVRRSEMALRWIRRNPGPASLVTAFVLSLVAGTTVATILAIQASRAATELREAVVRADANAAESERERQRADKNARAAEESKQRLIEQAFNWEEALKVLLVNAEQAQKTRSEHLPTNVLDWAKALLRSVATYAGEDNSLVASFEKRLDEFLRTCEDDARGNKEYRCQLHLIRGQLHQRMGRTQAAKETYERALPADHSKADVSEAPLLIARAELLVDEYGGAKELEHLLVDVLKAKSLLNAQFSAEAYDLMANLQVALARHESDSDAQLYLVTKAVESAETALKAPSAEPDKSRHLMQLAECYIAMAKCQPTGASAQEQYLMEAIKCADEASQIPRNAYRDRVWIIQGNAAEELASLPISAKSVKHSELYEQAIEHYKRAGKASDGPEVYLNIGRCYFRRDVDTKQPGEGYLSDARDALKKAIDTDPAMAAAYRWLGSVEEAKGNYAEASRYYAASVDLARRRLSYELPDYVQLWLRAALASQQSHSVLYTKLDRLLADPDFKPGTLRNKVVLTIATSFAQHGQFSDGIYQIDQEVGQDPATAKLQDVELLRGRGAVLGGFGALQRDRSEGLGALERAEANFDKVIELLGDKATWYDRHQAAQMRRMYWFASKERSSQIFDGKLRDSITLFDAALAQLNNLREMIGGDEARARRLFLDFISLLQAISEDQLLRMPPDTRRLVKDSPTRIRAAATSLGPEFKEMVSSLLTPELLTKIARVQGE